MNYSNYQLNKNQYL